ncbi:MAG: homoserine O-acetyltransferase [Saprospiraceae bacterium]|jgi:homoserine O-acetyltransferase|nr:homoserine O-acetyltransferase [Saprospiraceae bacterium]
MTSYQIFEHPESVVLEMGDKLEGLKIAYCTYGSLNIDKSNVIWVCHALTANSDVSDWWHKIFGKNKILDPTKYFIICANNLGSCYGTEAFIQKQDGNVERSSSMDAIITIRDMVKIHQILAKHLQIENVYMLIGGSQGAQQCMEWAIVSPDFAEYMVLLATNAKHSAWGIAFNEAQRMAIKAGPEGLKAARAIAMLSYRNYEMFERTADRDGGDIGDYGAATYQQHQGAKLAKRFTAGSYMVLSRAMDSHDVGRNRFSTDSALQKIKSKTLVIGISSDILFPNIEQKYLAENIPNAKLEIIDSPFGHDGFLTEGSIINNCIQKFIKEI